jgi:hypothetical protein
VASRVLSVRSGLFELGVQRDGDDSVLSTVETHPRASIEDEVYVSTNILLDSSNPATMGRSPPHRDFLSRRIIRRTSDLVSHPSAKAGRHLVTVRVSRASAMSSASVI